MKRVVCLVILFSMVLHCASRLGLVAYLYDSRYDIAYSMGLIADIPIAVCETEYFTKDAPFSIVLPDNQADEQMPVKHFQAREIVLFAEEIDKSIPSIFSALNITHNTATFESRYPAPELAIFHPPC